jgi:hypothetical protein
MLAKTCTMSLAIPSSLPAVLAGTVVDSSALLAGLFAAPFVDPRIKLR